MNVKLNQQGRAVEINYCCEDMKRLIIDFPVIKIGSEYDLLASLNSYYKKSNGVFFVTYSKEFDQFGIHYERECIKLNYCPFCGSKIVVQIENGSD